MRVFNLSLVEEGPRRLAAVNRNAAPHDLSGHVQLFWAVARCEITSTRMVIVRNADVGNETATHRPGQPKPERPKLNAAMAQQCGDSGRGHYSAPQKLLQLVGCRETKTGPGPKLRSTMKPVKR